MFLSGHSVERWSLCIGRNFLTVNTLEKRAGVGLNEEGGVIGVLGVCVNENGNI